MPGLYAWIVCLDCMPGLYAWFFLNDWEGALLKKIKIFLSIEVLKFRFLKYFLLTVLGGGGGLG